MGESRGMGSAVEVVVAAGGVGSEGGERGGLFILVVL